jgi:hypothetical protein
LLSDIDLRFMMVHFSYCSNSITTRLDGESRIL